MTNVITRDAIICKMYKEGKNTVEIGNVFEISKQRVHQILVRNGITYKDSGRAKNVIIKNNEKISKTENKILPSYGVSRSRWKFFRNMADKWSDTPLRYYKKQKKNAKSRGIKWDITLDEWWMIWENSGNFENRGRCKGQYVMARNGDKGAYSANNVEIKTCSENIKEGYNFR